MKKFIICKSTYDNIIQNLNTDNIIDNVSKRLVVSYDIAFDIVTLCGLRNSGAISDMLEVIGV